MPPPHQAPPRHRRPQGSRRRPSGAAGHQPGAADRRAGRVRRRSATARPPSCSSAGSACRSKGGRSSRRSSRGAPPSSRTTPAAIGASAPPRRPQTGGVVVDMLRELLAAAGARAAVRPRRARPRRTAREPLRPQVPERGRRGRPARIRASRRRRSTIGACGSCRGPSSRRGGGKGWRRHDAMYLIAETAAEIERAGPFPDVPLTVISGGRTPPRWTTSPEQARATALASSSWSSCRHWHARGRPGERALPAGHRPGGRRARRARAARRIVRVSTAAAAMRC